MAKLIINGGKQLNGIVKPVGNKNSIIKIIPACLLTDETVTIKNVPQSSDVLNMCEILQKLGGTIIWSDNGSTLQINAKGVNSYSLDADLADKIKASVMFLGPLLIRFGRAEMPTPQGCKLGTRPLDALIDGMIQMGAEYKHESGTYSLEGKNLEAKQIWQRFPSVTGTENLILIATRLNGTTEIYNAACEPHTQELCRFLNKMGAKISGIGSNKLIIEGVDKLGGTDWTIDSDHLDVGGYIAASVMTGGEITILDAVPEHIGIILQVYEKFGVRVNVDRQKKTVHVPKNQELIVQKTVKGDLIDIKALHRPLLPPDLIHVALVLALKAEGSAIFYNSFYEYGFFFVEELAKMKASTVMADPQRVITFGPTKFKGANLLCPNIIQAAYGLFLAALSAEGTSTLNEIGPLFRRYPEIVEKFNSLGADIKIIS